MLIAKSPIYQTGQIREFERLAAERFSLTGDVLMARAGKAALDFLLRRWPQAQQLVVFCGTGNNGGDGYVLAQLAKERGLTVTVYQVGDHSRVKNEVKNALDACRQTGVILAPFQEKMDVHADLIVDAICGIGVHENLRDEVVLAIECMQRAQAPIFAIDIPSGIDADTGDKLGTAVHATATITFIGLKLGLLTGSGAAYTGELVTNDLQLPSDLYSYIEPVAEKTILNTFASYLKPRQRDWHKGLSGHVLIIGGELGYAGAPRLAAEAALRAGAGLVSVATKVENAANLNSSRPEIMCHGITRPDDLNPLIEKVDVIVLGVGLGQTEWAKALWAHVIESKLPLVVDADGLNLLAGARRVNENWVLTPHPGEAGRLLDQSPQDIQSNRLEAAKAIAKQYGGVCVLKGAGSLIVAPNAMPALCDKGNAGMASAGMGDLLSGVIGGLMAQRIPTGEAAKMGVLIHAMAGDFAAKDGERGMIASDLLPSIRRLVNQANG